MRFATYLVTSLLLAMLPVAAHAIAISGHVKDSSGTPIAGVDVAFVDSGSGVTMADILSDAAGAYGVVIAPGTYDVRLTPPPDSIYVPQSLLGASLQVDTTLDLVLVATTSGGTIEYYGRVVDRYGAALPAGVRMYLCPLGGGACVSDDLDAGGNFDFALAAGTYQLQLQGSFGSQPTNAPAYFDLYRYVSLTADTNDTIVLQNRFVIGTVTDPDDTAVTDVSVGTNGFNVSFDGFHGYVYTSDVTDGSGNYGLIVFPGTGTLYAIPPQGSGVGNSSTALTVSTDVTLDIALSATVTYSGRIVDRNGAALPSAYMYLYLCLPDGTACSYGTVDDQGNFSAAASPGSYDLRLYRYAASSATFPGDFSLSRSLTLAGDTMETITLPNRTLSGHVLDTGARPVAYLPCDVTFYNVSFDGFTGSSQGTFTSDGTGVYQVQVLPGTGPLDVTVTAPSPVASARIALAIPDDTVSDLSLPPAVAYSAHVVDRNGTLLPPGQSTSLCPQVGGPCAYGTVDDQGDVALRVAGGDYYQYLTGNFSPAPPTVPSYYSLYRTITMTQDTTETIALANRFLTGTVVDPDGLPISDVALAAAFYPSFDGFAGYCTTQATTDAGGAFTMPVLAGTGTVQGTPPAEDGLVPFTLQNVVVQSDVTLGIFLQFVSEHAVETVGGGSTVTTDTEGDGATPFDPIETSVTSPNAGTIEISEAPIALDPPGRFRFLTQEIDITAPTATSVNPLVLVFRIDASRIPAGENETTLQVFRDGRPVPNCTGPAGIAFKDPCVSARLLLGDGDVALTVLSSHASAWHIGVGTETCTADAECDDGVPCTEDVCVNGYCALVPDDAACSDGNPCNGSEACRPDIGCRPGLPVTCSDDGDPCTVDECDPATGTCGAPVSCPDDGDLCTTDVCNPSTGQCGVPVQCFYDGDACTTDVCNPATGQCGVPVSCPDDGNPCTADVCVPPYGYCGIPDDTATCDDGDACTQNVCSYGYCNASLASFADGLCELDRWSTAPPCGAEVVDARLQQAIDGRIAAARSRIETAIAIGEPPARMNRLLHGAMRKLGRLYRPVFRAQGRGRISAECSSALQTRVGSNLNLLLGLYR